eukprot:CAMPEP_0170456952 /NCGR_PEP_ID=MMETSP0123-20130129/4405_1 /TAXON_ID=182087 /ORGANISM="Favella ehrenbergii, Strain Fehren 1" /LENGTH=36 /DNA_ID= /DNA_START= /DNA_END= /DNA_ORIENTATION=
MGAKLYVFGGVGKTQPFLSSIESLEIEAASDGGKPK